MQFFDRPVIERNIKKLAIQCAYNWLWNADTRTKEEIQARAESDMLDCLYLLFEPLPEQTMQELVQVWIMMYHGVQTELHKKPSEMGVIARDYQGRIISN